MADQADTFRREKRQHHRRAMNEDEERMDMAELAVVEAKPLSCGV
jgi:hypothetical protein